MYLHTDLKTSISMFYLYFDPSTLRVIKNWMTRLCQFCKNKYWKSSAGLLYIKYMGTVPYRRDCCGPRSPNIKVFRTTEIIFPACSVREKWPRARVLFHYALPKIFFFANFSTNMWNVTWKVVLTHLLVIQIPDVVQLTT